MRSGARRAMRLPQFLHTPIRIGLSSAVASFAALALSLALVAASPTAYCIDYYNSSHDFISPGDNNYYYTEVDTTALCYNDITDNCYSNLKYLTQGGKGALTVNTKIPPIVYNPSNQHVLEWLGSYENPSDCSTYKYTGLGCWIQTGWELGYSSSCGGTINASVPEVYVEIYDDTTPYPGSTCLLSTFPGAATAAYDARYVSDVGSLHRYHVYYQDPASSTIQDLAYGDFNDLNTEESAKSEVYSGPDGSICPVLAQTVKGYWNLDGYATSPSTFASTMSLRLNGSWYDWTTSVVQTDYWPKAGLIPAPPYLIQPTSNFTTNFTEWESGGPNG